MKTKRDVVKTATVTINTWRDFTKVAQLMSGDDWFFRGHKDAEWKLDSSLDRDISAQIGSGANAYKRNNGKKLHEAERFAIETFKLMAGQRHMFGNDTVDILATMQHYGTKTRLLDFSTSIYVALFFAYEEKITRKPRTIYAVKYNDIVNLSKLKAQFKDIINERYWGYISWGEDVEEHRRVNNVVLRQFIFDVAQKNINGEDPSRGVLPLYTIGTNERLMAQAGAFLMPRNFEGFAVNLAETLGVSEDEVNRPSRCIRDIAHRFLGEKKLEFSLIRLLFSVELENNAWDVLDQANISPRSIYPDLTGIAKSIHYSNRFLRLGLS